MANSIMAVQTTDAEASPRVMLDYRRSSGKDEYSYLCGSWSAAALAPWKLFRPLTQMDLMDCVLSREGRPSEGSSRHNRKVGIRGVIPTSE